MLKKRITDPKTKVSYEPNGHLTDTLKDMTISAFNTEYLAFINKKKSLGARALSI
jgi:hypothetical protein